MILALFPWFFLACPVRAQEQAPPRPLGESEQAGHERMLALLAEIKASVPERHPFLETKTLRETLKQIATLDPERQALKLLTKLTLAATYQMRAGENDAAVALFEELCGKADAGRAVEFVEKRLRFDGQANVLR